MDTERIRRGGGFLCVAAACGVLLLSAGDDPIAQFFAVGAVIAALCGLAEIASGLTKPKD